MLAWSKFNHEKSGDRVAVPIQIDTKNVRRAYPVVQRKSRFENIADASRNAKDDKMYCLMLLLLALCGAGILVCVLVAGIIYASQTGATHT